MIGPYCTETVTIKQHKGTDKWGTPNTRTSVTVNARVDYTRKLITTVEGDLVTSELSVLMRPRTIITSGFSSRAANTIAYEDLITVDGIDHEIGSIRKLQDFSTRALEVRLR